MISTAPRSRLTAEAYAARSARLAGRLLVLGLPGEGTVTAAAAAHRAGLPETDVNLMRALARAGLVVALEGPRPRHWRLTAAGRLAQQRLFEAHQLTEATSEAPV